jgi:sterol desaturase/sphingolipid hydroxylase (fatty acid hydroxylase superfamily)
MLHQVTLHPEYSGCTLLGQNCMITTTGCNYVLTASSTPAGNMTIQCETGKLITNRQHHRLHHHHRPQTPANNKVDYANAGTG